MNAPRSRPDTNRDIRITGGRITEVGLYRKNTSLKLSFWQGLHIHTHTFACNFSPFNNIPLWSRLFVQPFITFCRYHYTEQGGPRKVLESHILYKHETKVTGTRLIWTIFRRKFYRIVELGWVVFAPELSLWSNMIHLSTESTLAKHLGGLEKR